MKDVSIPIKLILLIVVKSDFILKKKSIEAYAHILYIDDREPAELAELIAKHCSIPIEVKRLPVGDYLCEDVIVERKEINDLASSIIDRRLFRQADKLCKFKYPYILISGRKANIRSEINYHSILGAKAYMAARGITINTEEDDKDLIYFMLKVFEKHGKLQVVFNDK